MLNRAFRLILCLGSFYVSCVMFFNAVLSHLKPLTSVSLITLSLMSIFQIINLVGLYWFNRLMIKFASGLETLLIVNAILDLFIFRYFIAVEVISLVISGLTLVLIYCHDESRKPSSGA